jgi:hypothetical protein
MRPPRLAAALLLTFLVASGATAAARTSAATLGAPDDVHGFLLRADEPSADTFTRTPSFAWKPVAGAARYQFQLATARTFASGALLYSSSSLTSPAVSLPVALPWVTGTPYSLYAHVRAIGADGSTGPWSDSFGFNMRWSSMPTPLAAPSGMIRWTSVDGATAYDVWYLDPNPQKIFRTRTNVADEREYYTFHTQAAYTGAIHWRIRAERALGGLTNGKSKNGLPAVSYGPWSPIYTSTNSALTAGAPLTGVETISDTTSTAATPAAHHLMPAFVYSGDTDPAGEVANLYRVYVATDRDCVNVVFRGAIVGSPAYAPRLTGPLGLPQSLAGVGAAATSWLGDGSEGATFTADHIHFDPNEAEAADSTPLQSGEDDSPSTPPAGTTGTGTGTTTPATTTPTATTTGGAPGQASLDLDQSLVGPPVDLWDTDWPTGRYYWTVVPVGTFSEATVTSTLSAAAAVGATTISVGGASQFLTGDTLSIGAGPSLETVSVVDVSGSSVTVSPALRFAHGGGESVVRLGGNVEYRDLELPQDACSAGRVLTFGKTSEPATATNSSRAPFVSGLSPTGKLFSATTTTPSVYGAPLVSWQPALGAGAYEVQWSATRYPFKIAATPILTYGTSATLPLTPGKWWYRVRGLNLGLPGGARAMGWSDVVGIVVAKPKFTIVGGSSGASAANTTTFDEGAFSLDLPKTWKQVTSKDTVYLFFAQDTKAHSGVRGTVNVVQASGRAGRSMSAWAADLATQAKDLATSGVSSKVVNEPVGQAVVLTYDSTKIVKGHTLRFWQYVFDGGAQAYVVTFAATPSTSAVYSKVAANAAASFLLG